MKFLKRLVPLTIGLLLAVPLAAQSPSNADEFRRFEVYAAPLSYSRQGQLNSLGAGASLTVNLTDSFGLVADFSFHRSSLKARDPQMMLFRGGPRIILSRHGRIRTFAQGLVGQAIVTQGVGELFSNPGPGYNRFTAFTMLIGGGADVAFKPWLALRPVDVGYSAFNASKLQFGGWSSGVRISSGLVIRF